MPFEFPVDLRILTGRLAMVRYKVKAIGFRFPSARK
jgi:hypothetical protein